MRKSLCAMFCAMSAFAEDAKPYALESTLPAEVIVGQTAMAHLVLTPKAPHHTNKDYPTRLKVSGPSDVVLSKPEQRVGDAVTFTDTRMEFAVPFRATKAGSYELAVDFKSAVCTKETCTPLKEKLVWSIRVK